MATLSFNTLIATSFSRTSFARTDAAIFKAYAQLSSGARITKASDDPAGLAIAAGLSASIATISQASRNAADASSALTMADGALSQVQDISIRLKELAVTSANGTYSQDQRNAIQAEYSALTQEIQRIGATTEFNGHKLLDGSKLTVQLGDSSTLQVGGVDLASLAASVSAENVLSQNGASKAMTAIDDFSAKITSARTSAIGAPMSRLDSAQQNLESRRVAEFSALAQIADVNVVGAVAELSKNKVLQGYQTTLQAQASQMQSKNLLALLIA